MKRLILSSLMVLLSVSFTMGQNVTVLISGLVTELNTGLPIANQQIYIMSDSAYPNTGYFNVVYTNNLGEFNDQAVVPANPPLMFFIGTADCNNYWHQATGLSSNSPIYVTFSICKPLPPPNCQAMFYAVPDSSNPSGGSLNWQFYDISTGNPNQWFWEFGDGTTSSQQNPYHTYAAAGTYTVTLSINTPDTCQSTYTQLIYAGNNFPNCSAGFTFSQSGTTTVSFFDLSFGNIIAWHWDFGDNTSASVQNPQHIFQQSGFYTVCLTIFTADSCSSSFCSTIQIGGGPGQCQALYYAVPDSGNPSGSLSWYFIDNSIGNVIQWNWDFGDGTTSTQQFPVHTYASAGNYLVCLSILTQDTCSSTYCSNIQAGGGNITFTIYGQVMAGNSPLDEGLGILYLIDPMTGIQFAIDTTMIDSSGYYMFTFTSFIPCAVYVKAYPTANSLYYNTFLPTYYINAALWSDAEPIYPYNGSVGPYNISLVPVINPIAGPGNINGYITTGNKMMSSGVGIPDIEILLFDADDVPLAMDYSDNTGYFSFQNLPYGTYKVHAEVAFVPTYPAMVTLSSSNPSNTVAIVYDGSTIVTGLNDVSQLAGFEIQAVYPNPARNEFFVSLNTDKQGSVEAVLIDITGKVALVKNLTVTAGTNDYSITVDQLKPGVYTLCLINREGNKVYRKLSVIR